jgi:hypothetical protein
MLRFFEDSRILLSVCALLGGAGCQFGADTFSSTIQDPITNRTETTGLSSIQISSFLPAALNQVVEQGNSQTFFVSATSGRGAVTYTWTVNGTVVQTGSVGSLSFVANSYPVGNHTLQVVASDGVGEEAVTWTVKRNAPPVIGACTPFTTAPYRVSVGSVANVGATVSDANGDTLTYTWKLNNVASGLTVSTGASGSSASFTPDSSLVGANTVEMIVTDGTAEASCTWQVQVNAFISACNSLSTGQVCSKVGLVQVGLGLNPATQANSFVLRARAVTFDGGNPIVADDANHVIWYWNRGTSDVLRFNQTIAAGSVAIITGNGGAGNTGLNGLATDANLNTPTDVFFHEPTAGDERIYIADGGNNRVLRVNAGGVIASVNVTACGQPRGVAVHGTSLFVACGNSHTVRNFDLVGATTSTVAGTNGTAGSSGDGGLATSARLNNPYHVRVDPNGSLYISEFSGCRIRFVNRTNSSITYYAGSGTVVTTNGHGGTLSNALINTLVGVSGADSCPTINPATQDNVHPRLAGGVLRNPFNLAISNFNASTGHAQEIYIADYNNSAVRLVNATGSAIAIGGQTFNSNTINIIGGDTNVAGTAMASGYSGEGSKAFNTRFNRPIDAAISPTNELWISDYDNLRLRYLCLNQASCGGASPAGIAEGDTILAMGAGINRFGFVGNNTPASTSLLNNPFAVLFEPSTETLFFSDYTNHRVRVVSRFGMVSDAVGRGNGTAVPDDEFPGNVVLNNPSGLAFHGSGNHLLIVDRANHVVRAWNRSTTSQNTIAGWSIQADRVSRIGGTPATAGCSGNATMDARDALFTNPEGVVSDGSSVFVADTGCHCVRRIAADGQMTTVAGDCGVSGNALTEGGTTFAAAGATGRMNGPRQIALDSAGNLYIADAGNNKIRFVNLALAGNARLFGGVVMVPNQHMATIVGGSGTPSNSEGVLATAANLSTPMGVIVRGTTGTASSSGTLCYSASGHHNARCLSLSNGLVNTVLGQNPGSAKAGAPMGFTQEGISGTGNGAGIFVYLNTPRFMSWDAATGTGFYIGDYGNHLIRQLK